MPEILTTPSYVVPLIASLLAGYLLGSIPFGLLFTKLAGLGDIRKVGSGNIGATNVLRTGRKGLAAATLIADILKGALPAALAYSWYGPDPAMFTGAGAVLGHCYPLWLKFRGGRGVATAAGVMAALSPVVLVAAAVVFLVTVGLSRYVSLGSMTAAVTAPLFALVLAGNGLLALLYAFLALIVVLRHVPNIRRLLAGTENRLDLGRSG